MNLEKSKRLGRGLEALLSTSAPGPSRSDTPAVESGLREVAVAEIQPNPFQPRKEFAEDELQELQESIQRQGLLQPVTVRPRSGSAGWELVAGERRLRAASRLGWTTIPAIVKEVDDRTLLSLALVENLQRADLNAVEEAEGYQRLLSEFSLTQQEVAEVVGKNRSTVANMLRLLALPAGVRQMIRDDRLTVGHARALLAIDDSSRVGELARRIVAKGLSVRDVERVARELAPARRRNGKKRAENKNRGAEVRVIEDRLRRYLQTDVTVTLTAPEKGEIRVRFYSADDLDRLLGLVTHSVE